MILKSTNKLLKPFRLGVVSMVEVRRLLRNIKHGLRRIAVPFIGVTAHTRSKDREVDMKRNVMLISVLAFAPLTGFARQQMIPAGSLIQCTISEPKLSSKTTAIGDPVLCHVDHAERFGSTMLPYYSFLGGRFEDYKDPRHLVGKGWMELKFDRMIIQPDTIIPIDAKVVAVPGFNVDRDGRILGKGHAVRDAVEWSIPILWPIDLLMLPRRGPRPTLKTETRLTLKVMDDLMVPVTDQPQTDSHGLVHREPIAALEPPPAPSTAQDDSRPVTAMAEDPSVNAEEPVTTAYVPMPVAPPLVVYQPYAPVAVAPPSVRRPYRPRLGMAADANAYYQPRQIVRPPRANAYGAPMYGYGINRFATSQRANPSGGWQHGMARFYAGAGVARGGGGRH